MCNSCCDFAMITTRRRMRRQDIVNCAKLWWIPSCLCLCKGNIIFILTFIWIYCNIVSLSLLIVPRGCEHHKQIYKRFRFLTLIEGFLEVELMVTKRDDRQQGAYRAFCLWKVGRQSFAKRRYRVERRPYPGQACSPHCNLVFN